MKYVKTMLVLTMAFAGTQTFAQEKQEKQWDPEKMAQRQTERLTESLDLTEEQAAKVKAIQLDAIVDRREARENGEWTKENRREFIQQQRSEKETELKEVLTDEQEQKWEELKKEFRGKDRRGHKGQRDIKPEEKAARQTERMKESLNLSAEQVAQVKEIFLAGAEARKAFRSQENISREERKEARMQQHKQQEAALKEVLTEAQWTQWEQLKEARKAQQREHKGKKGHGQDGQGFRGEKSPENSKE